MKRIANQGIIRGFTAWQDLYLQAARQKRMLAAAGARITRPGLAMAMSHWKGDWEAERRLTLAQTVQRRAQGKLGTAEEEIAEVRAKPDPNPNPKPNPDPNPSPNPQPQPQPEP